MAGFRLVSILLIGGLALPASALSQTPAGVVATPAQGALQATVHKPAVSSKTSPPTMPAPKPKTAALLSAPKPAPVPPLPAKPVTTAAAKAAHPATAEPAKPETPAKDMPKVGSVTGLPVQRFASLRSDDVNLRVGPGTRYPISWVYKRRELPVQIEREYEIWRLVSDPDGNLGWVHQANLVGRRTFILRGETRTMRRSADDSSAAVAVLKPGVVGRVLNCAAESTWCEVQVGEYRGYLRREAFWGTFPGEAVN